MDFHSQYECEFYSQKGEYDLPKALIWNGEPVADFDPRSGHGIANNEFGGGSRYPRIVEL